MKELTNIHLSETDYQELMTQFRPEPITDANNQTLMTEEDLRHPDTVAYLNSHPPRPTSKPCPDTFYLNCLCRHNKGKDSALLVEMEQAGLLGRELLIKDITILLNAYQEYSIPISRTEVETIFKRLLGRFKSSMMHGYYLERNKKNGENRYKLTKNIDYP